MKDADDTSFNRMALQSPLPVIALFSTPRAAAHAQVYAATRRLALRFRDRLRIVAVNVDESPAIAATYGVQVAPHYLFLRAGEALAYTTGELPDVLLDLFAEEALALERPQYGHWQPLEQQIEERLLIPLVERWGWSYRRQYACRLPGAGARARRGVIDLLVWQGEPDGVSRPLTLVETKRRIRDHVELARAVEQARGYAQVVATPSFVVADAAAYRVYCLEDGHARPVAHYHAARSPDGDFALRDVLLALR